MGGIDPDFEGLFRTLTKGALNIKYLGFLPRDALLELIGYCSVYVFPSLEEGLAMSLVEALVGLTCNCYFQFWCDRIDKRWQRRLYYSCWRRQGYKRKAVAPI